MSSFRMERVNKELLREIVYLLEFSIKDDTVKDAVITSVNCTKDLKHAKVWFTTLNEEKRELTHEALKSAAGQLRKLMGERMYLRTTPQLEFCIDTSQDYGRRIDSLLDSLAIKSEETDSDSDGT
ncbi:MAG: 30S ribosome-binding factor RbfA [Synergistaceae bacterium]|nr:30S ribosome-binding factor RbfA [Synergistaceae bacterium]